MPCFSKPRTPTVIERQKKALARLEAALTQGTVIAVIGAAGGISFKGWNDKEDISDICAYRALSAAQSAALRKAIARAEAVSGRKVEARAIAAGIHSHDGGVTWGTH